MEEIEEFLVMSDFSCYYDPSTGEMVVFVKDLLRIFEEFNKKKE